MNHISYEKWLQYVKGELDSDTEKQLDDHLYSCDQCMSVYMEAVEAQEQLLPMMSNEDMFTNMVMQQVEGQKNKTIHSKKQGFYQKAIFHYLVAAAMTIILMTSGVFSHLTNALNDFEANKKKEPSFVMGLMDKSVSLIDKVEKESKEGNK